MLKSTFARDHLCRAGYDVLKGEVTESRSFEDLQNRGHAITESPVASLVQETLELVNSIQGAFVAALDRPEVLALHAMEQAIFVLFEDIGEQARADFPKWASSQTLGHLEK